MIAKILITCLILFAVTFSQQKPASAPQNRPVSLEILPFTSITFEIALPDSTVLPLQPIPIILKQSNQTNGRVLGYESMSFNKPISINVRKANEERKTVLSQFGPGLVAVAYNHVEVPPGHTSEAKGWISISLDRAFSEPGIYEMQAVMANADTTLFVYSNIVTIEIQQPTGPDLGAYNLIRGKPFQGYLFSGAEFTAVKPTLELLSTLYPNTPYGRSSIFKLGEAYFHQRDYPRALANLLRLENDNDFIHAEKVRRYLAEIRRAQAP